MRIKTTLVIVLLWTIFIAVSFIWNYSSIYTNIHKLALNQGKAYFSEMQITRQWNAEHGGVYVPVTTKTKPNKHLDTTNRDLHFKRLDLHLTKINPAFMTRQISELAKDKSPIQYHITSLNPIRPENKADEWETIQLLSFEKGNTESFEILKSEGIYRYMAPLKVEQKCMKCHEKQGYKVGDIRGGISVNMNASGFIKSASQQSNTISIIHIIVYTFGTLGIILFRRYSFRKLKDLEFANDVIYEKNLMLEKSSRKLKETSIELKRSNLTKDKMFSIIAHDLKGPFNSILGFSDYQIKEINEATLLKAKEHFKRINQEGNKAYDLLLNLLDWSRTQTGNISLNKETQPINDIIELSIDLYKSQIEEKDIQIIKAIPNTIEGEFDKQMIFTVIRNILANAIKFSKRNGKIVISAFITKNKLIEVAIKDSGYGMDEETLTHLFSIEDAHFIKKSEKSGTGLGLIVCKEFIEMHKGEIYAESALGKGSTIIFKIPKNQ